MVNKKYHIIAIFLFFPLSLFSLTHLEGDFWIDPAYVYNEAVENIEFPYPNVLPPGEKEEIAYRLLIDEIRRVFSGMIYGYSFRYIPLDYSRNVDEVFEVEPLALIPWGDPALEISDVGFDDGLFYVHAKYTLSEYNSERVKIWRNISMIGSAGSGICNFLEPQSRQNALYDSFKNSIKDYLSARHYNKPYEISGLVGLRDIPYYTIDSGAYMAISKVVLQIDEIRDYPSF